MALNSNSYLSLEMVFTTSIKLESQPLNTWFQLLKFITAAALGAQLGSVVEPPTDVATTWAGIARQRKPRRK